MPSLSKTDVCKSISVFAVQQLMQWIICSCSVDLAKPFLENMYPVEL